MAFKHNTALTSDGVLQQGDYESTSGHLLDSQAEGDLIVADTSTTMTRLAAGAADTVLTSNGTTPSYNKLTTSNLTDATLVTEADAIASNDNDTTIPTSAAVKDYVDNQVSGTTLTFEDDATVTGSVDLDAANLKILGGTNVTTNRTAANEITVNLDADISVTSVTASTAISVANGGTGATSFTDAGVLIGNSTGAVQSTSAGTSGQVLTSNGAGVDPTFQDAAGSMNVQTFTSSGTWTKPSGATMVMVELIGGGSGGSSGRKGAVGSTRYGGSGGGSSASIYYAFAASELSSTETVTIGAGGTGGASVTTNSTNGNHGTDGGTSIFGSTTLATCRGGAATTANFYATSYGSGGSNNDGYTWGHYGVEGGYGNSFSSSRNGNSSVRTGSGGAGGLINSLNTEYAGGDGGAPNVSYSNYSMSTVDDLVSASGGATGGGAGSNATASSGGGGGGGGANDTGDAGSGGNGASPGGGGGGGGASTDSVGNSGAGGNGGDGRVRVWTW
jgi:hypothetical protein